MFERRPIPVRITSRTAINNRSSNKRCMENTMHSAQSLSMEPSRNLTNLIPIRKNKNPGLSKFLPNIFLLNAQSIRNKVDELSVRANQLNSDILCITETWLTEYIPDEVVRINGFTLVNGRCGGVCIYIRDNFPFIVRTDLSHSTIECLWIVVRPKWLPRCISRIAIASIYLPPSISTTEIDEFYDYFCFSVDSLVSESMETAKIAIGDFNQRSNHFQERRLQSQCGLKQVVHLPTRKDVTLDLIFSNIAYFYTKPCTLPPLDSSDHLMVEWKSKGIERRENITRKVTVRPIKDSNMEVFGQWINTYDWSSVTSLSTVNDKLQKFTQIINDKVDNVFPQHSVKFHADDKPFMTGRIKWLLTKRDKAYMKGDRQKFKVLRNRVTSEIKKEKRKFYGKKVKPVRSSNPKAWWSGIKRICGTNKGQRISLVHPEFGVSLTSKQSAEYINNFFINLTGEYSQVSKEYLTTDSDLPLPIILREIIAQKLKQIDVNKSPGPFDPPQKIIKRFAEQLSIPLSDIINSSFREKCFGDIWKACDSCPIPKVIPCTTVENIRPITLTSIFSKVQESFALEWMLEDSKDEISEHQFGGMSGSSSVLALLEMFHTWFSALEHPKAVIRIVFLDFSKAFDLIDHNILLSDFKAIGVRPALLPWLASYLSGRSQRIKFDGIVSEFKCLHAGVPQGSKIGPFAFITKINTLPLIAVTDKNSGKEQVSVFMDDTTLSEILDLRSHVSGSQIGNTQANINRILCYSQQEKMVLNPKKTKEMIIDFRTIKTELPISTIADHPIARASSYKLLGIWVDSDLKWQSNTCSIIKKGRKRLYFLKVLKKYGAPVNDLIAFYCSVVRSTLEYGDVLWHGGLTKSQSLDIERIQKRALRLIVPDLDYEQALKHLKIETLSERREIHCIKLVKKMSSSSHKLHHLLPDRVDDVRQRQTRYDGRKFYNFKCRTDRFKNSPLVYAINSYNGTI